ncbi:MAG: hypothetical protein QME41_03815 [Actinomycetota bacterium]|nr:hypothetical protein [Actinomycetota bacterium]
MKKTITKVSIAMVALLVVISVGMILTLGAGDKGASEKEVNEMKKALESHLELPYASTFELRKEMLVFEAIPKEHKEKARNRLYRDLLEVTAEDYSKRVAENFVGLIEVLEQEYGERIIDGGQKVLAIETIELESPDKAHIIAIVWSGSKYGKFNKAMKKTEPLYAADNTVVKRYPMQKIDGKWKVSGIESVVKGVPMDDDNNTYGPPTPEEAKARFKDVSLTWDEKIRRGIPFGDN